MLFGRIKIYLLILRPNLCRDCSRGMLFLLFIYNVFNFYFHFRYKFSFEYAVAAVLVNIAWFILSKLFFCLIIFLGLIKILKVLRT